MAQARWARTLWACDYKEEARWARGARFPSPLVVGRPLPQFHSTTFASLLVTCEQSVVLGGPTRREHPPWCTASLQRCRLQAARNKDATAAVSRRRRKHDAAGTEKAANGPRRGPGRPARNATQRNRRAARRKSRLEHAIFFIGSAVHYYSSSTLIA